MSDVITRQLEGMASTLRVLSEQVLVDAASASHPVAFCCNVAVELAPEEGEEDFRLWAPYVAACLAAEAIAISARLSDEASVGEALATRRTPSSWRPYETGEPWEGNTAARLRAMLAEQDAEPAKEAP